ncbi:hypothetical protein TCAL_02797 [Tigriopus californicus]|uniref:Amine oxidase domain-containing protein n=2 Tax=Tigriopus californicus TaxID=6832 RepID=A0A553NZP1_TIGCA|nr:hypothetical protein TCAL_02797 [Tigriopus californicus]|eukprot:TCALIF_02797-PA protein Name:"Similar to Paox Peroxisomal N(1)-acetyl-spermine/spermidine oxidase (Mus musculus)" AED:0.01 eAED:0.01 QI:58/1/0.5/1/1/1/2/0/466
MHQIIIIGAGTSGLMSALRLAEAGYDDILILEAEMRIGGRILTIPKNGKWLELGAQWIHGKGKNPLWRFVQEHKIPIHAEVNRDGEGRFVRNDGREMPSSILEETMVKLDFIHDDCNKFAKDPKKFAQLSIGEVFKKEFDTWLHEEKIGHEPHEHTEWRRQFFQWYIKWEECDAGCDSLDEQSAVSWGQYVDYDDDTSFAEGYVSLLNKIKELLDKTNVEIKLDHAVTSIQYDLEGGAQLTCENGEIFQASHVISTASLGYLKQHHNELFQPPLPSRMVNAIESIGFGTIDRIKLDFVAPFWDASNPGYMILWDRNINDEPLNRSTWVQHVVGFDAVIDHPNMLMAWVSGEAARIMESLPDQTIATQLCDVLRLVTKKSLPDLKSVDVTRWYTNPFQLGVYSYRSPKTDQKGLGPKDLGEPIIVLGQPRILFAGEATDPDHYGTVHGAFTAGEREAKRLIDFFKAQ